MFRSLKNKVLITTLKTSACATMVFGLFLSLWVLDAQAESKSCKAEADAIPGFEITSSPIKLSENEISTLTGEKTTLSAYQGSVVVLNHWATWCAPCIHEMPTLTNLSEKFEEAAAVVVPLSMDRFGHAKVAEFVERQNWSNAVFLSDKTMSVGREYEVRNIPTTQVFSRNGQEFGRLSGPYEWDKPAIINLISCLAHH